MVLNRYEHTKINNNRLPDSWKTQNALDDLAEFLQENWEQRSVFYEDGEITSGQQFLEFTGQQGIKTKKYIGTIVFKGEQLNIYPKVFSTEKDDHETDDLSQKHLLNNLVRWIEYCNKLEYPFLNISSELNFAADGKVYHKINVVHIELYTDCKDLSVEQKVEAVLDKHGIFYDKLETWIESEKLYEVLYSFEMEV